MPMPSHRPGSRSTSQTRIFQLSYIGVLLSVTWSLGCVFAPLYPLRQENHRKCVFGDPFIDFKHVFTPKSGVSLKNQFPRYLGGFSSLKILFDKNIVGEQSGCGVHVCPKVQFWPLKRFFVVLLYLDKIL